MLCDHRLLWRPQLRRNSLRRASLMLQQTAQQLLQHNRWQDRPDVRSCGLLDTLSKAEVKRQEAIWEVAVSEEAYLKDVHTLQELVLKPMQVGKAWCACLCVSLVCGHTHAQTHVRTHTPCLCALLLGLQALFRKTQTKTGDSPLDFNYRVRRE